MHQYEQVFEVIKQAGKEGVSFPEIDKKFNFHVGHTLQTLRRKNLIKRVVGKKNPYIYVCT